MSWSCSGRTARRWRCGRETPNRHRCCSPSPRADREARMYLPTATATEQALLQGFLLGGLYALTALGLSLVLGVLRIINLAHGEFLILGAFLGYYWLQRTGVDPLLGLVVVAPVVAGVGFVVQRWALSPLVRHGDEPALLTTFSLSIIGQNLFIILFTADSRLINRSYGFRALRIGAVSVPEIYLISFAAALVIFGAVHLLMRPAGAGQRRRPGRRRGRGRPGTTGPCPHVRAGRGLRGDRRGASGDRVLVRRDHPHQLPADRFRGRRPWRPGKRCGSARRRDCPRRRRVRRGRRLRRRLPGLHRADGLPGDPRPAAAGHLRLGAAMTNTPAPTTSAVEHGTSSAASRLSRALAARRARPRVPLLAAGAVVVIVYPFLASTYLLQIGFQILLYVAIGEAWNLIAGYGGMVSLGSAAFIGTGAYNPAQLTR